MKFSEPPHSQLIMSQEQDIEAGLMKPKIEEPLLVQSTAPIVSPTAAKNSEVDNNESRSPFTPEPVAESKPNGSRLKFFFDGKMVLELSDKKDGEKVSWVPVTKKTYWPPPLPGRPQRQESTTSYSVSDDSSVQSSPWQRDTRWKQPAPKRARCQDRTFYMLVPKSERSRRCSSHVEYRKPFLVQLPHCQCKRTTTRPRGAELSKRRLSLPQMVQKLGERASAMSRAAEFSTHSVRIKEEWRPCEVRSAKDFHLTAVLGSPEQSTRKRAWKESDRARSADAYLKKTKAQQSVSALVAAPLALSSNSKGFDKHSSYSIDSLLAKDTLNSASANPEGNRGPSFLRTLLKAPASSVSPASGSSPSSVSVTLASKVKVNSASPSRNGHSKGDSVSTPRHSPRSQVQTPPQDAAGLHLPRTSGGGTPRPPYSASPGPRFNPAVLTGLLPRMAGIPGLPPPWEMYNPYMTQLLGASPSWMSYSWPPPLGALPSAAFGFTEGLMMPPNAAPSAIVHKTNGASIAESDNCSSSSSSSSNNSRSVIVKPSSTSKESLKSVEDALIQDVPLNLSKSRSRESR